MKITSLRIQNASKFDTKTRVYFFYSKKSTAPGPETNLFEAIENRRTQPWRDFRKLMPEVINYFGLDGVSYSWSQYAGCSCPCSPGFVITGHRGKKIFVDVE